jgi:glycosyltransferase involved in cell wall biosynthesis
LRLGVLTSLGRTLDAFFPELVREWQKDGVDVFGAAGDPAQLVDSDSIPGLTQVPQPSNFKTPRALADWITERSLDVVLTNTATASALVRVRKPAVPIIYFCHGLHWADNGEWAPVWKTVERQLLRHTTAAIVSNTEDEAWFSKHLGEGRVMRSPFGVGVPLARFKRTPTPPFSGLVRLAWIGDFSERKQPDVAVEIARRLRDAGMDFQLTMAGDGPLKVRVRSLVAAHGLDKHVLLPGRSSSGQLISASHALVHTSKWEGLARVLLESAAIGRNAYGFDVKGVRDVANVAVVPSGDVAAMSHLIVEDIRAGLPEQAFPEPSQMASAAHAELVLRFIREQLA